MIYPLDWVSDWAYHRIKKKERLPMTNTNDWPEAYRMILTRKSIRKICCWPLTP